MRSLLAPKVLGLIGGVCVLVVNVASRIYGDIATPTTYRLLVACCLIGFFAGVCGAGWAIVVRKSVNQDSCVRVITFCAVVALVAVWSSVAALPNFIYTGLH